MPFLRDTCMTPNTWHFTCDTCQIHMTPNTWHFTCDTWHIYMTPNTWHLTFDTWHIHMAPTVTHDTLHVTRDTYTMYITRGTYIHMTCHTRHLRLKTNFSRAISALYANKKFSSSTFIFQWTCRPSRHTLSFIWKENFSLQESWANKRPFPPLWQAKMEISSSSLLTFPSSSFSKDSLI